MNQRDSPTRMSLIGRLQHAPDQDAWREFVEIYEPLLLRMLGRNGLQMSDAQDVCQQVLTEVVRDVERWQPDGKAASFRRWLFRIAKNRVLRFLERQRNTAAVQQGRGLTGLLESVPSSDPSLSDIFEREYRDQLLKRAARDIRSEFRDATWQAFWQSAIHGQAVAEVAAELGMSPGSIYVARSRIVARLRSRVTEITGDEED